MKKIIIGIAIFFWAIFVSVSGSAKADNVVSFNDVNSLNFVKKTGKYNIKNIKKICTYDYCDFVRGSTKLESIEIFTKDYLKTLDKEIAANLKVKGVRITKIIVN